MRAGWGLVLVASAAAAGAVATAVGFGPEVSSADVVPNPAAVRDRAIAFYQARVARDTFSARDFAELARLYLARGRETGNATDAARAEHHAHRSLALRRHRNTPAFFTLAASLLAQHRFTDALDVAQQLTDWDSASVSARALLGEVQLELGRYTEAERTFSTLRTYQAELSVAPRLARWEELRGHPEEARRLLQLAQRTAERRHGVPPEQLAWMHLRLGDLALRYGHLGEAERELRAGLAVSRDDYRVLGAMARLAAARRRWREAIDFGERSIAVALDPATLGVLSDASAAAGDSLKAREYARAMEVTVLQQPGPFHRDWSLFLLDHGRAVDTVLARAREELRIRQDVYGYDLLAWALHRQGRDAEARVAMRHALALGTRDPQLLRHAEMIDRAGRPKEGIP